MSMGDLMGGFNGEPLRKNEIAMIDEAIGLNDPEETVDEAEARDRLNLGEHPWGAHDRHLIGPKLQEIIERMDPPKRKRPPIAAEPKLRQPPGRRVDPARPEKAPVQVVRSIPVITDGVLISNFRVSNLSPRRVDIGVQDRHDILIANMSSSPIWVNTFSELSPTAANFVGVPLKAVSAAGNFDGGVLRLSVRENVRFWAQAVNVGNNFLIVTIETSLRE